MKRFDCKCCKCGLFRVTKCHILMCHRPNSSQLYCICQNQWQKTPTKTNVTSILTFKNTGLHLKNYKPIVSTQYFKEDSQIYAVGSIKLQHTNSLCVLVALPFVCVCFNLCACTALGCSMHWDGLGLMVWH